MGPHSVKTGQIVYVNDTGLIRIPDGGGQKPSDTDTTKKFKRVPEVYLRLFMESVDPNIVQTVTNDVRSEVTVVASTAGFAGDPASSTTDDHGPIRFGHGEGVALVRPKANNEYGCLPWEEKFDGEAVVVKRGECTFLEKLVEATIAGASGVIALSDEEHGINPSATPDEVKAYGKLLDEVAIVTVNKAESAVVTAMLDASELYGGQVVMAVSAGTGKTEEATLDEKRTRAKEGNRVLYLNNHPLLNTRLMV